jgi:hypothetical protein
MNLFILDILRILSIAQNVQCLLAGQVANTELEKDVETNDRVVV